ncbi:MAG: DUF1643 domain-containing protein [Rhodospirillales bacterium]|nr:DUF1643 domain-containing protein [Rhodospirillales bacterium]
MRADAPSRRQHDPGGKVRLRVAADTVSDAAFSADDRYRWWLERRWDGMPIGSGGLPVQIGMNPSTADIDCNDPTVAGCCDRARRWGYGGLVMLNAFGYRATRKEDLLAVDDPVGAENDATIRRFAAAAPLVVVGWGQPPQSLRGRGAAIARLLAEIGVQPMCFAINADGSPKHPLYVRRDAPLVPWVPPPP